MNIVLTLPLSLPPSFHSPLCDHIHSDTGTVAIKSPTLRAVGLSVFMDRPPESIDMTCILCQAGTKDSASQEKVFVQAVCVQRSCVLRRGDCTEVKELDTSKTGLASSLSSLWSHHVSFVSVCVFLVDFDYLAARADHPLGVFTSGCGHHMHSECWRK